jgi:hypothetical protein
MGIQTVSQALSNENGGFSPFGFKNRIINGAMVIDQRNAAASLNPADQAYSIDRWKCRRSQASKYTIQQNAGSVTPPSGFTNYLGVTSSSSYSLLSTDYFAVQQIIEGYNVSDLGWGAVGAQTVTLSFWVRSSLTGTFGGALNNGAEVRAYGFTYTINNANTWEYKTVIISGDTSGTWLTTNGIGLYVNFNLGTGSTYGSATNGSWTAGSTQFTPSGTVSVVSTNAATWYVTGVQLEKAPQATAFDYRDYGRELALCQRYCMAWRIDGVAQQYIAVGQAYNTTTAIFMLPLPVTPRVTPTGITTSAVAGFGSLTSGAGGSTGSTLIWNASSNQALTMNYTATAGFTTAGFATALYFNGTAGAYIFTTGSEL